MMIEPTKATSSPVPDRTVIWHRELTRHARCPVCGHDGDTRLLLDVDSTAEAGKRVTFAKCPDCGTLFQVDFVTPRYEYYHVEAVALKFYIEQGAGLETLILPACIARNLPIQNYLEVGCGFGFGLDFARHSFGWNVRGIDPAPLAEQGRKVLGLQIESRYLTRREAANDIAYGAIAAIEVLEHIDFPAEFLAILRSNLSDDGLLVLSTPNAEYIEFGIESSSFFSVLTPGYHAILYTPDSLTLALRNAGFSDTQVVVRGATLLAVAGAGTSGIDIDRAFDPALYREYLEWRMSTVEPGSALDVGLTYRLFKHFVNQGLYAEAEPLVTRLAQILLKRDGIDLLDPHTLLAHAAQPRTFEEFVAALPACLTGILYFSAMLRLNLHGDRAAAVSYFYAAHIVGALFRKAMRVFGIDDGEIADLERSAREHIRIVLGWMAE